MEVECPDGTTLPVEVGCTYGRRNLDAAADDSISREQFRLDPVDGLADVVQLQILGRNGDASRLITLDCSSFRHVQLKK
jgi:hypothetical protein